MTNDSRTVAVVGLGYVSPTTALCLASRGLRVVGADVDSSSVDAINNKSLPIHESSLDRIPVESIEKGFKATTKVPSSEVYFITVGTPGKKDGSIDLNHIEKASEEIGDAIRELGADSYPSVVVKSTVLPGTTKTLLNQDLSAPQKGKD